MKTLADRVAAMIVRVVIIFAVIAGLGLQREVVVHQSHALATEYPEFAYMRFPLTAMVSIITAAGVVIAYCLWALVGKIAKRTFTDRATELYIDGILWALIGSAVVSIAAIMYMFAATHRQQPGLFIAFVSVSIASFGIAALMWIMRSLNQQAQEDALVLAKLRSTH